MAKSRKLLGFDIGNYRMKIAVTTDGRLDRLISVPVPENTVKEDKVVGFEVLGDYIASVLAENKIKIKDAALSLSNQIVYTKTDTKMPLMNEDQLKVNLPYEFRDFIEGNKSDYIYDYKVLSVSEDSINLFAVAVEEELMRKYQAMFDRAGLRLRTIVPEYLGFGNILASLKSVSGNLDFAILDAGERSLRIHFFTAGRYEITRELDYGCHMLVQAYAEQSGEDVRIARMNIESGKFGNDEALEQLRETMRLISVHIMRVINFYNFNNPNSTLDTVYYCGGGSRIKHLIEDVFENTEITPKPLSALMTEGGIKIGEDVDLSPAAYGVTLKQEGEK